VHRKSLNAFPRELGSQEAKGPDGEKGPTSGEKSNAKVHEGKKESA